MTVINKLASSLNRRDEAPNQELAKELAAANNNEGINELVANLKNKSKDIQNDCIKVLYEIGELKPVLIAAFAKDFIELLDSKNNRLQWGAMTAIDTLTTEAPGLVYDALSKIIDAAGKGSVITKDHAMNILIKLCGFEQYSDDAFSIFIEQMHSSLPNQLPMYAENALPIITGKNKIAFIQVLTSRLPDMEKDTKRKRIEKVLRKLDR